MARWQRIPPLPCPRPGRRFRAGELRRSRGERLHRRRGGGPARAARLVRHGAAGPLEILRRAFEILTEERELFAEIIVRENGKAFSDALGEADYAKEFFRWFAEEAVRVPGDFRLSPSGDKHIVVDRQPIGVCLLVTPSNFPAAMATRKIGPALAAGCTTVLKQARETPLTAAYMMEVMARAGVPRGVVNLVTPVPTGPAVAAMLRHPAVRKLSFTGSTEVGRVLLAEAAENVVSSSMELGGNAPFVVLPGADVDAAVSGALVAKMRNGGSACTAANRFYVHRSLHDEFAKKLADALAAFKVGPGIERDNQLGALVSVGERDKVAELVTAAVAQGAKVTLGGTPSDHGAFYPPTVLVDVEHGWPSTRPRYSGRYPRSSATTTWMRRYGWPTTPSTASSRTSTVRSATRCAWPAHRLGHGRGQPRGAQRPGSTVRRHEAERSGPGRQFRRDPRVPRGKVHRH